MQKSFYLDANYQYNQRIIAKSNWQSGKYKSLVKRTLRECKRGDCKNIFSVKPSSQKIYCSQGCASVVNNSKRLGEKKQRFCLECNNFLKNRQNKYCSIKCQVNFQYSSYIISWKNGNEDGNKGITTKILSAHLRRYLLEKYNKKCSACGWNKKHPITGVIPLEIDHIDGNSENNRENNLRLLCPNCHSLTPYFKNLNKGNGRKWRSNKYIKNS